MGCAATERNGKLRKGYGQGITSLPRRCGRRLQICCIFCSVNWLILEPFRGHLPGHVSKLTAQLLRRFQDQKNHDYRCLGCRLQHTKKVISR